MLLVPYFSKDSTQLTDHWLHFLAIELGEMINTGWLGMGKGKNQSINRHCRWISQWSHHFFHESALAVFANPYSLNQSLRHWLILEAQGPCPKDRHNFSHSIINMHIPSDRLPQKAIIVYEVCFHLLTVSLLSSQIFLHFTNLSRVSNSAYPR